MVGKSQKHIRQAAASLDLLRFVNYRDYLAAVYRRVQETQDGYSYLDFSEALALSRSNVSYLIVTGRRKLTPTTVEKVVKGLGFTGLNRRYFVTLVGYNNARLPEDREALFQKLVDLRAEGLASDRSRDLLQYFSEWFHPVIREMCGLAIFKSDPAWITEQLTQKLLPKQAKESLELLERLGLIEFDANNGRHVIKGGHILPDEEVETMAAIRFHQKMIEIGKEAMTRIPADRRDINSITLSLSDKVAKEAVKKLHACIHSIMALEEQSKGKHVYQLNIQLFPFTKGAGHE